MMYDCTAATEAANVIADQQTDLVTLHKSYTRYEILLMILVLQEDSNTKCCHHLA